MTKSSASMLSENKRISSLDIMRGLIMILMVLDHTRDFFHVHAFDFEPEDLTQSYPGLFFTRWITHFCAPGFALLAGISAFLYGEKIQDRKKLAFWLLSRGLVLIILELTIIRFAWRFSFDYSSIPGLVIWALGWCMIFLSGFIFLPRKIILVLSLVIIFGHNLLDTIKMPENTFSDLLWTFLHENKKIQFTPDFGIFILYPVLSMLGIMLFGYGIGIIFKKEFDSLKRKKILLYAGLFSLLLFVSIRYINIYGDLHPWAMQKDNMFTLMSFLNTHKYPFSLCYTLMTIGVILIVLAFLEKKESQLLDRVRTFGQEPMFFYILHLFVLHLLAIISALILFHDRLDHIFQGKWSHLAKDYGFDLPIVYLVWLLVLLLLYPACKKYHSWKKGRENFIFRYI